MRVTPILLALFAVAAPCLAAEPPTSLGGTSFVAESGVLTSVKDLEAFADGVYASKWDITKAARVDLTVRSEKMPMPSGT